MPGYINGNNKSLGISLILCSFSRIIVIDSSLEPVAFLSSGFILWSRP